MTYTQDTESAERRAHREKCRYRSEYEDFCFLRSHHGPFGGVTMGCTASADCPRMKRYDKQENKRNMRKIMFSDKYGLTQAVLEGRKTMTRRVVGNFAPVVSDVRLNELGCAEARHGSVWFPAGKKKNPKYRVGDVVAVAQSYKDAGYHPSYTIDEFHPNIENEAGWSNMMFVKAGLMPHRIRITSVRIERLQDISDEDCLREGIYKQDPRPGIPALYAFETCKDQYGATLAKRWYVSPREAFAALIDKVSGKGTWESNPFVYVYEFEKVR